MGGKVNEKYVAIPYFTFLTSSHVKINENQTISDWTDQKQN